MPSFTCQVPNLMHSGPICEITISPSSETENLLKQEGKTVPTIKVSGLIDTGASGTAISRKVVESLNLVSRGITNISTPSSESHPTRVFDVALYVNKVVVDSIRAVEATLTFQNIDCLIGRDVLQHGVLIYVGYINQFTLSF